VIIIFGGDVLKPAVHRASEIAALGGGVYMRRTVESIITSLFLARFYKSALCKPTPASYEPAMYGWYSAVDYPVTKVDVNNMYPTTLLRLIHIGVCKADGLDVVMRFMAARARYYSRYVVVVNVSESDYAVYRQEGKRCRSRDVKEHIGAEPADYKTAVDALKSTGCTGVVIPAKDLFKYTVLMAIGRIKHYSTATWHTVISEAHSRFYSVVNRFRVDCPDCIAGIYVDTAFLFGGVSGFISLLNEAGYGVKVDGVDPRGTLVSPVNYLVSVKLGAWLIGVVDRGRDAVDVPPEEYPTARRLYAYKVAHVDRRSMPIVEAWAKYVNRHVGVRLVKVLDRAVAIKDTSGIYGASFHWGVVDRELLRINRMLRLMYAE